LHLSAAAKLFPTIHFGFCFPNACDHGGVADFVIGVLNPTVPSCELAHVVTEIL